MNIQKRLKQSHMSKNDFIELTFVAINQTLSVAKLSVNMHVYNKERVCSEIDTAILMLNNLKEII